LISYHTPGVYLERRDITPLTIGMPRSDIAGFAGIAMRGPVLQPVKIESWQQFVSTFGDFIPQAYLAYAVYGFFANGGRTCWISRVADRLSARTATKEFGDVVIAAQSPGTWGNQIYVEPFMSGNEVTAVLLRYPDGTEQFLRAPFETEPVARDNLFGLPQNALDNRSEIDSLVKITTLPLPNNLPEADFLSGGTDGLADLTPEHFEEAFENLDKISEIGVVAAPDLMPKLPIDLKTKKPIINCCCDATAPPPKPPAPAEFPPAFTDDQIKDLQVSLTARAETLRYRFAILDAGGERSTPEQALCWRRGFPNSSFSGLYYPWILVDDPLRLTGLVRVVPPSGHIAGIFARSDQRKGVHKPPMNEVVEGVSDVRFSVADVDHGELNDNNVNVVRIMPGRGVRLMGTRTLFRDILLRYVNVRRLLSTIEKALEQSLNWTVFEPNNPQLWAEIDRVVRSFLETLFRLGMLDGETSEEAYSVRCDESTNPPAETDLGRVTCEIGVQAPYPAEFVIITLGISRDGIQVREGREQNA
jgi:uncharacterized protein